MKKALIEAGLSKNEVEIYLVLLRLGIAPVSRLAKETGLHRPNIYDILEKLQAKGLVSSFKEGNVKLFKSASPQRILDFADEKRENIAKIIPDLEAFSKISKEETVVEVFKGKAGVKSVLNEFLNNAKSGEEFVWIGAAHVFDRIMPFLIQQFVRRCNELGLKERGIIRTGEKIIYPIKNHEYRRLPKKYPSPSMFLQNRNIVVVFVLTPPMYAIVVMNQEIAQSYKSYFEFMWRFSKKI